MRINSWQSKTKSMDLVKLGRAFGKFRNGKSGKIGKYPPKLQRMAVETLDLGLNASETARASGVDVQSILNWRKSISPLVPQPKELELVDAGRVDASEHDMAKVFLPSGVCIELSVSSLSSSFFERIIGNAP